MWILAVLISGIYNFIFNIAGLLESNNTSDDIECITKVKDLYRSCMDIGMT